VSLNAAKAAREACKAERVDAAPNATPGLPAVSPGNRRYRIRRAVILPPAIFLSRELGADGQKATSSGPNISVNATKRSGGAV